MTKTATPTAEPEPVWAGTLDEWNARSVHRAELPSGMRVEFRFPTLGDLIANGHLPDTLLQAAVDEWAAPGALAETAKARFDALPEKPTAEEEQEAQDFASNAGEQLAAINRHMCAAALVNPKVTADDLVGLDLADLQMLALILAREVGFDAAGRRIGAEPLDTFAPFRDEHGCPPDCQACQNARDRLSTTHG